MKKTDNLEAVEVLRDLGGADSGLCEALERCDREIAAISTLDPQTHKAYLTVMGQSDREYERRLIAKGYDPRFDDPEDCE